MGIWCYKMKKPNIKEIALMRAGGHSSESIGSVYGVTREHIRTYYFSQLNKLSPKKIEQLIKLGEIPERTFKELKSKIGNYAYQWISEKVKENWYRPIEEPVDAYIHYGMSEEDNLEFKELSEEEQNQIYDELEKVASIVNVSDDE